MTDIVFSGRPGSTRSQFGFFAFGYDPMDEVVVTWLGNQDKDDNSQIMTFGYDEGDLPIVLELGVPTIISKAQAAKARDDGAILISMGTF